MAAISDTRRILDALATQTAAFNGLDRSVAGLQEKVLNIGVQVTVLGQEVQTIRDSKASRPELEASEVRVERHLAESKAEISRELVRVETSVQKDVDGFQGMYESLVGEMKDLGSKMDTVVTAGKAHEIQVILIDERLRKIEPLRDTWLQLLGARWLVGVISALLGSGGTLLVFRFFLQAAK